MHNFGLSFWLLVLSTLLTVVMFVYISCQKDRKQLHNVFCLNLFFCTHTYCFFILGLEIRAAKYPKNTAAAIPPAAAFTPPVKAPIKPDC